MKVADGFLCSIDEVDPLPGDALEPDWTIYADCLGCPVFWRGEYGKDNEAVRFRVDAHIQAMGHRVRWIDAEQEFYGREPDVLRVAS